MLIPEAAICRANSLPTPDEAPVTIAQGPNLFLSSATIIFLLRSSCLRSPYAHRGGEYRQNTKCHSSDRHLVVKFSFDPSLISAGSGESGIRLKLGVNYAPNCNLV